MKLIEYSSLIINPTLWGQIYISFIFGAHMHMPFINLAPFHFVFKTKPSILKDIRILKQFVKKKSLKIVKSERLTYKRHLTIFLNFQQLS